MNTNLHQFRTRRNICAATGLATLLLAAPAWAQTPAEINNLRNTVGNQIEAATILGGDFGMSGASL